MNTGDWVATVALAPVVYARTGSAVWLSVSFLFTQVPSALAAPLSGMIADRLDRKRTMIICDLLGAAAYAAMAVTGSPLGSITLGALAALLLAVWACLLRGRPSRTWPGKVIWRGRMARSRRLRMPGSWRVRRWAEFYAVAGAGGAFAPMPCRSSSPRL